MCSVGCTARSGRIGSGVIIRGRAGMGSGLACGGMGTGGIGNGYGLRLSFFDLVLLM